ncbi:MAG: hypothetical protein KAR08_01840, partial [Candidatus Heimdallarchaeota archaeon]|nr:hypothetical protein [Candidatus Heimdallarchaeota archaeon]
MKEIQSKYSQKYTTIFFIISKLGKHKTLYGTTLTKLLFKSKYPNSPAKFDTSTKEYDKIRTSFRHWTSFLQRQGYITSHKIHNKKSLQYRLTNKGLAILDITEKF